MEKIFLKYFYEKIIALKKYFLILLILNCFLSINTVISQNTYFSKIFNQHQTSSLSNSILVIDSSYLISGNSVDSTTGNQVVTLVKIDSSGYLQNWKIYGKPSHTFYCGGSGSLTKTNNNTYSLGGTISNNINTYGFLIKFNESLDSLWSRPLYDSLTVNSLFSTINQCKQISDNDFILAGQTEGYSQYDTRILLIKTDSMGNKKWQKTYGGSYIDYARSVIPTPDGGYLLGGYWYHAGMNYSGNGIVYKVDSLGDLEWKKDIGGPFKDGIAYVCLSNDNKYIIGTTYSESEDNIDYPLRRINILKLDTNGSVIWSKKYGKIKSGSTLSNIKVLNNGNIISVGTSYVKEHPDSNGQFCGWLLLVNSQGDSIWYRDYKKLNNQDGGDNNLYDVSPTKNGGFTACGQVSSYIVPQSMWVIKVDSLGCDTPDCNSASIKPQINNSGIKVYPNPANEYFTIEYRTGNKYNRVWLEIYDLTGRCLMKKDLKAGDNDEMIDIQDLITGMYLVSIYGDENIIASERLNIVK